MVVARKRFGQNFLQDQTIINAILASISPRRDDDFVEIGPGLGALTQPLLSAVGRLNVIELDRDLIPILEKSCRQLGDLFVHQMDVLQCHLTNLVKQTIKANKVRLIGNLPYNISTPLLFHLFNHLDVISDMTFMLQKEVVDRLAATVGESNYGRLTIMAQYYCQVESLLAVSPQDFRPAPKVDSAVVRLLPIISRQSPRLLATDVMMLAKVAAAAFQQRRKTLRNSLKKLMTAQQLHQLDIDSTLRAENLTVEQYVRISNYLSALENGESK